MKGEGDLFTFNTMEMRRGSNSKKCMGVLADIIVSYIVKVIQKNGTVLPLEPFDSYQIYNKNFITGFMYLYRLN